MINGSAGTTTITDVNNSPYTGGIAITGFTGDGTWEYAPYLASSFKPVPAVSTSNALLFLPSVAKLQYTPNPGTLAPATFTYVAWDTTTGTNGTSVDLSQAGATGGTTAYSTASDTATITFNHAPVLTAGVPQTVMGRSTTGSSPVTSPLTAFINTGSANATAISDSDPGAVVGGIAVVGVTGSGTWAYSTDGTNFTTIDPSTGNSTAVVLANNVTLRYTPGTDLSITPKITYRAWDTTDGKQTGNIVDLSAAASVGGTTAYSTAEDSAEVLVNHAPVLVPATPGPAPMGTTDQNTAITIPLSTFINNTAGTGTVITDSDPGAVVGGIAITQVVGNGTWAYSLDGTNFVNIDKTKISNTSALLLPEGAALRYTPDSKNGETAKITYEAWDTTAGSSGQLFDASATGGATAFSVASDTAALVVTDVNVAPVITPASPSLGATQQNAAKVVALTSFINNGSGTTVISDVKTNAVVGGIAVVGITGAGTWEYSLDGGTTFTAITSVSASSALLLPRDAQLRYTPVTTPVNNETATITFRAWDTTTGSPGGTADTTANGGATAYSTATDTASLLVNDAPVLTPATSSPSLGIAPNTKPTVITLTQFINSTGGTTITDPDLNAVVGGIALIGTTVTTGGTWEYSLDGGTTFTAVGTVSTASALLLPKGASLRYTPNGATGSATITYYAWDTTTGTAGKTVDLSGSGATGGSTAYSTATDTATLTVRPAPTGITLTPNSANPVPDISPIGSTVGVLSSITTDTTDTFTYSLVSADSTGKTYPDNAWFAISGNQLNTAKTFGDAGNKGSYSILVQTTDQAGLSAEQVLTITLIDKTPPLVTINQQAGQADPTYYPTVYFVVTFSEPVTDFTAADVTLSGTAPGA